MSCVETISSVVGTEACVVKLTNRDVFDPSSFSGIPGLRLGWQDYLLQYMISVNVNSIMLKSLTNPGETGISSREQASRLRATSYVLLGGDVFKLFVRRPELYPHSWKGDSDDEVHYIHFYGSEILTQKGTQYVPCLYWYEGAVRWSFERLGNEKRSNILAAVLGNPFR